MKEKCTGNIVMPLNKPDAAGNMGYSLSFDYEITWDADNNVGVNFENIKFSGPGTWDEFSEGEDYPYEKMKSVVMDDYEK